MQDIRKNRCRICLGNQNLADMFANRISEKITYCTTVQVSPDDPFPSKICKKCGFYLNVAYILRMVCEWTDLKLQQELRHTNSISTAISNTQQAQCNTFSYMENTRNGKRPSNKHLIEFLLNRKFLETFTIKNNEIKPPEEQTEDCENSIYNQQTSIEHNRNYIHHSNKFDEEIVTIKEEAQTIQEVVNDQLHQELVNSVKYDTVFYNEEIPLSTKKADLINNTPGITIINEEIIFINGNNGPIDENNLLINEDSLGVEEEGLVVDISLLQKEDVLENEVVIEEQNLISESNIIDGKITTEDCVLNVDDEEAILNIEEYKETDAECSSVENSVNNKAVNFINEKTAMEHHVLDEENILVDDGLFYECEIHQDILCNKSICREVCLNNEDPLLHNLTSQATLLENDEVDLTSLEINLKSCSCVQNKAENLEKLSNGKHITLSNISLHDFENFEKEQFNNALSDSITSQNDHIDSDRSSKLNKSLSKNLGQLENRVGRHIAKKNAGQPPKRYSPTPEVTKLVSLTQKQKIAKNDPSIAPKHTKVNETEDKLENKTELKEENSILDQEHIPESDLLIPESTLEETIITDGFYFTNEDGEILESNFDNLENNFDNQENKTNAKMERQVKRNRRRKRSKNGTAKLKRKVNIFIDQAVMIPVYPKRNKCSIKKHPTKIKLQNDLRQNFNVVEISDGDYDYSSETEIRTDDDDYYNSEIEIRTDDCEYNSETEIRNDDDNCRNAQQSYNPTTQRFSNKKNKKRVRTDHTCKLCNKSFPFPSHLQRHLTAHIGIKRFLCKYCNKGFLHSYNMSVHLRSHTGNFPLQCNICKRGFVSSSVLERHKRSHTGETPFQCRYCSQLFCHASSLKMHEKMHSNRPSFPCDICYKVFSYKNSLNAHKKVHTGVKPHSCSVCHKKFTRRTSVLRHMSLHSEVQTFKCQTCGAVLRNRSDLVKHRKVHITNHTRNVK